MTYNSLPEAFHLYSSVVDANWTATAALNAGRLSDCYAIGL